MSEIEPKETLPKASRRMFLGLGSDPWNPENYLGDWNQKWDRPRPPASSAGVSRRWWESTVTTPDWDVPGRTRNRSVLNLLPSQKPTLGGRLGSNWFLRQSAGPYAWKWTEPETQKFPSSLSSGESSPRLPYLPSKGDVPESAKYQPDWYVARAKFKQYKSPSLSLPRHWEVMDPEEQQDFIRRSNRPSQEKRLRLADLAHNQDAWEHSQWGRSHP